MLDFQQPCDGSHSTHALLSVMPRASRHESPLERSQGGSWLARGGRLGREKKQPRKSSVTGALEWEQRSPASSCPC